ncbi:MAG: hypothetical protein RLY86_792 [Pseudomonadota bacterium]|jgi:cell division protein FtsB
MIATRSFTNGINRLLGQIVGPVLGVSVIAYFAYHTVHGDRGIVAWNQLQQEVAEAERVLTQVRAERGELEQRTRLLRPDSLDPDMLEERARIQLNHVHPDDLVILLPGRPAPQ